MCEVVQSGEWKALTPSRLPGIIDPDRGLMMNQHDKTILRDLAKRVAEIADSPQMTELRETWKRHHALERVRPMILVSPEGSWQELLPAGRAAVRGPGRARL